MSRRILIALVSLCLAVGLQAQFARTLHSSIEVGEAGEILIDIAGDVVVEPWAGNTVLVETQVKMYNASKGIFVYYVETAGRYDVVHELSGSRLRVYSMDGQRKPIQSKRGLSTEEVRTRVFIPSNFAGKGSGPYAMVTNDGR